MGDNAFLFQYKGKGEMKYNVSYHSNLEQDCFLPLNVVHLSCHLKTDLKNRSSIAGQNLAIHITLFSDKLYLYIHGSYLF